MHELILWCGFLGAWLLVVGPVYQAALELREEDFEHERIRASMSEVDPPAPVSPLLLLLPPVWWWQRRRRREQFRDEVMAHISDADYEAFSSYMNKARGWMLVAIGGLLIAAKETFELVEGHEWPTWVFWVLLVLGIVAAVGNLAVTARSQRDELERRQVARATSEG